MIGKSSRFVCHYQENHKYYDTIIETEGGWGNYFANSMGSWIDLFVYKLKIHNKLTISQYLYIETNKYYRKKQL